jgi:hypothetical protein
MLLIHDSDNDVPIQSSLNNLIVYEPSSNLEAIFFASMRQKTTPSPSFDMPYKFKGMMDIVPILLVNHTSLDLILNDFFVRIIEDKKQTCTFRAPYDDIVGFFIKGEFILFYSF